jgi:hypothetical protein
MAPRPTTITSKLSATGVLLSVACRHNAGKPSEGIVVIELAQNFRGGARPVIVYPLKLTVPAVAEYFQFLEYISFHRVTARVTSESGIIAKSAPLEHDPDT